MTWNGKDFFLPKNVLLLVTVLINFFFFLENKKKTKKNPSWSILDGYSSPCFDLKVLYKSYFDVHHSSIFMTLFRTRFKVNVDFCFVFFQSFIKYSWREKGRNKTQSVTTTSLDGLKPQPLPHFTPPPPFPVLNLSKPKSAGYRILYHTTNTLSIFFCLRLF